MSDTRIAEVHGRRVWDSRGRPTVEAELRLIGGAWGRAIAPAGASTGSGEAIELRDGGVRLGGRGVSRAVAAINGEIAAALRGHDAADQAAIDRVLIDLDGTAQKRRLGGNALVAVSMAALHAAAAAAGRPLWAHLLGDAAAVLPLPEIQIFGGGAHAGRRVDIQDFMVVAPRAALVRRGARMDRRGLWRRRGDDGRARALAGGRRRGRVLAGLRLERGGAGRADAGDRARRLHARRRDRDLGRCRRVRILRRRICTDWRATAGRSTPTAWPRC